MLIKPKNRPKAIKIPKSISIPLAILPIISQKWTTAFVAKLFGTPIKHKTPKRELEMDIKSIQKSIFIPTINKNVNVYEYGKSDLQIHKYCKAMCTFLHSISSNFQLFLEQKQM